MNKIAVVSNSMWSTGYHCEWVWFRYIVKQHVLLYESYLKCDYARKWWRKFCHKLSGVTVPSTTGIHKHIDEVWSNGSLLHKKSFQKCHVLTERKVDKIGAG